MALGSIKETLVGAPFALLLAAMAFTGANVPIGKMIVAEMPVHLFLVVRFVIASAALAALMTPADRRTIREALPRAGLDILILAGIGSVLFTVLLLEGTKRTTGSEAGIITATLPAVVALIAAIILRQRIGTIGAAAIVLSVLGLAVVQLGAIGAAPTGGTAPAFGNALVFAAVVCEAIFVLRSQRTAAMMSPVALSFAVSTASLLLALPLLAFEFALTDAWAATTQVSTGTWLIAVWYALSASVFCTILWYLGVAHVPSWQAGLATTALPIAALAVSAAALGERLTAWQGIGTVLVVVAIVIGALARRSHDPAAPVSGAGPRSDGALPRAACPAAIDRAQQGGRKGRETHE